jgi:ADP-ribosylglycohydrolase
VLGAITGDVIGSVFEWDNVKSKDFQLFSPDSCFTDDTVLTVALAEAILEGTDYAEVMREYYNRYPHAGYGGRFHEWALSDSPAPYSSWGNGAAMRISPVAYAFSALDEVLLNAELFTAVTHNHPEGIKGGQATAAAVFLARKGGSKADIRSFVQDRFGYDLSRTVDQIRPTYQFDESCQRTVPEALVCVLEAQDFEDAIRNAISIGGDSDTLACIAGSIAEPLFGGVPKRIAETVLARLDRRLHRVTTQFIAKYVAGEA